MAEYQRKCENWLTDFGRWTLPRSEAPETFIFWTGLFSIASALRRRVFISKDDLGSWECAPNMYIMFVAQAGKARKTTTAAYAEDLTDEIPQLTKAPDLITKESLLTTITMADDCSMCVNAGEFSEFIVKSGVEMYGFLTKAYDGVKRLSASTLSRGLELATRPCINLIGATTPEWIAANMPESVIGGGFASRVIFIYEEKVRRRQLLYRGKLNKEELAELRINLVADLEHIATNLAGAFRLTPEAEEYAEYWYQTTGEQGATEHYKMSGYYERRPAHMFKLAMCLHVARQDDLVLDMKDINDAISLLKQVEKKLPRTFEAIGKNQYAVDMRRILTFVEDNDLVSREDILANFFASAEPAKLSELIGGLLAAGKIKIIGTSEGDRIAVNTPHRNGRSTQTSSQPSPSSQADDPSTSDAHPPEHQGMNAESHQS